MYGPKSDNSSLVILLKLNKNFFETDIVFFEDFIATEYFFLT